ncbi:B9 domain-containing protein 2 [Phytophthora pseudosyringae]|uniref:B9 domain-containing protein 2 n=1 Tax=Phytophthora pseudosyringae TaxID=221518 RepID=A0A8T1VZ65_9STRA|nr:B9 domain-containing protein 2 [Phytophthora pseudosyringae]
MASVHVVGELLGASGLSCLDEHEAFSVSHVLDMLSLHPSSALSYFCKWRIVTEDPAKPQRGEASWQVMQGETRGQTQLHTASSGGSLAMPDLYRQSSEGRTLLPKMDTVWAHPLELHLATRNMDAWSYWPRLEFQVWSLDGFQLEILCGTAVIPVPMATNEYVLDVPLVLHEPPTILGSVARAVGLPFQEQSHKVSGGAWGQVIRGTGTLYLRLAVLSRGFGTTTAA